MSVITEAFVLTLSEWHRIRRCQLTGCGGALWPFCPVNLPPERVPRHHQLPNETLTLIKGAVSNSVLRQTGRQEFYPGAAGGSR